MRRCSFKSRDLTLPSDKVLDRIKFKALADDKLNVAQMMISVLHKVENIPIAKQENAVTTEQEISLTLYQTTIFSTSRNRKNLQTTK